MNEEFTYRRIVDSLRRLHIAGGYDWPGKPVGSKAATAAWWWACYFVREALSAAAPEKKTVRTAHLNSMGEGVGYGLSS